MVGKSQRLRMNIEFEVESGLQLTLVSKLIRDQLGLLRPEIVVIESELYEAEPLTLEALYGTV